MENFLKITIISIFILNQMIQSESNPIDTSLVQYENSIPDWRKHVTIEDEINACYEICDQCFADTVTKFFKPKIFKHLICLS